MNIKSIGNKIKGNPRMVEGTVYSSSSAVFPIF